MHGGSAVSKQGGRVGPFHTPHHSRGGVSPWSGYCVSLPLRPPLCPDANTRQPTQKGRGKTQAASKAKVSTSDQQLMFLAWGSRGRVRVCHESGLPSGTRGVGGRVRGRVGEENGRMTPKSWLCCRHPPVVLTTTFQPLKCLVP